MQVADGLAMALVIAGAAALAAGVYACAEASDLHAVYWAFVGVAALRAASSLCVQGSAT